MLANLNIHIFFPEYASLGGRENEIGCVLRAKFENGKFYKFKKKYCDLYFYLQAMTQERRRYGFVLERQCSLAKHYLSYHTQGVTIYQQNIEDWNEIAKTREFLPEAVENMFSSRMRVK